ncbi:MAG: class I SAM-dependent methyltransferase [Patescibacteria group bacterium]|nr:class I SAM-dependent methyltransferase [Patescibacteria group bacterium]
MRDETAQDLLKMNAETYDNVASEFSNTREFVYPALYKLNDYIKEGDRVLDVGCGNGRIVRIFGDKRIDYLGVDSSENLVKIARHNLPERRFSVADALDLAIGEKDFDAVILSAVLHHIPSNELRRKVLKNIWSVLRPGGRLLMANWNLWQPMFWKYHIKYTLRRLAGKQDLDPGDILREWSGSGHSRYFHAFTLNELKSAGRDAGFSEISNFYTLRSAEPGNWLKSDNIFSIWKK